MSNPNNKTKSDTPKAAPKRYLVEVRGVLHIDAPDSETARALARAWIAKAADSVDLPEPQENRVRVGWMRPYPDDVD